MSGEIVVQSPGVGSLIAPAMNVALAKERLMQLQQFVKEYLVDGEDFGTIPGTPKPTLYKPGADKLCELYSLADEYEVTQRTEDFDRGLFDYEVKCLLVRKPDMTLVSTGLGSCNSYETKYRWRDSKRLCPTCGKDAIIKGKVEYGGGWICFAKKGGCGGKFADNDPNIVGQTVGRVQNEDIADIKNTILKMAKKRAKIDAVLSATRSSGLFTQDVEDWDIPKAEGAISHEPAGASAQPQTAQPPTQKPAASWQASQPPARPTTTQQSGQQAHQQQETAPAAAQPQVGQCKFIPPNGLTTVIKAVKEITPIPARAATDTLPAMKGVRARLIVTFLGKYGGCGEASCFDTKLWPVLKDSVGLECHLQIAEKDSNGKHYINIEDVIYRDGQEVTFTAEGQMLLDGQPPE
jgi:hypothetical protein